MPPVTPTPAWGVVLRFDSRSRFRQMTSMLPSDKKRCATKGGFMLLLRGRKHHIRMRNRTGLSAGRVAYEDVKSIVRSMAAAYYVWYRTQKRCLWRASL